MFKICKSSAGNAVGNSVINVVRNSAGNLAGNGLGNDAVFSLNTWLRTIYCLQTIHEPACVILTLFQYFHHCRNKPMKRQTKPNEFNSINQIILRINNKKLVFNNSFEI